MCGRFTLKTPPAQWTQWLLPIVDFEASVADWQPRYNIAPTQSIYAVLRDGADRLVIERLRWGLVPSWSDDLSIGSRMINARSETLSEKKSFLGPLQKRRCLIIADGYYEWQKSPSGAKYAYWIFPRQGGLFQFAGLWESNRRADIRPVRTCTIITASAVGAMKRVHDRTPVNLDLCAAEQWLKADVDGEAARTLLGPLNEETVQLRSVGSHVNNVRHEDPACIEPQAEL